MKIAILGDPHIGCNKYTRKRNMDFSKQFVEAVNTSLKSKVKAVLILGDVFDSSAYRRSVDSFAFYLSEISTAILNAKNMGVPIFSIAGNHEYGRGRRGGELRILSELGFIRLIKDETIEFNGTNISGISWKNDKKTFCDSLAKLDKPDSNSILLIHQLCAGSRHIPVKFCDISKEDLKGWNTVFTGHHHIYEDIGYAIAPGSLEVHLATEISEKGFIIYDSESKKYEFIKLPPSRPFKYSEFDVTGKIASNAEEELVKWTESISSSNMLVVIKLMGTLSSGRSSDINFNRIISAGIQKGCIAISIENQITDVIRSAPEIRKLVDFDTFLKQRFKTESKKAIEYIEEIREEEDSFSTLLLDKIIEESGKRKR
jgi:DNA repair exonuclease SbcCD nuclease subunit